MIVVSIITPTYNRCTLLSENIASVICQKYRQIEHVIIDNLSSDGTNKIVERYRAEAPYSVTYIREHDEGIYNAMNKGIRAAAGKWLLFLGSDDRLIDQYILRNIFSAKKLPDKVELLAGGVLFGKVREASKYYPSYYDKRLRYHAFQHQGSFIRKSIFERFGLYNERFRIAADGVFNGRFYHKVEYMILDFPVAWSLPGGASGEYNLRNIWEYAVTSFLYRKFPVSKKAEYALELMKAIVREVIGLAARSGIVKWLRKNKSKCGIQRVKKDD